MMTTWQVIATGAAVAMVMFVLVLWIALCCVARRADENAERMARAAREAFVDREG
jgi:hypothetical protein